MLPMPLRHTLAVLIARRVSVFPVRETPNKGKAHEAQGSVEVEQFTMHEEIIPWLEVRKAAVTEARRAVTTEAIERKRVTTSLLYVTTGRDRRSAAFALSAMTRRRAQAKNVLGFPPKRFAPLRASCQADVNTFSIDLYIGKPRHGFKVYTSIKNAKRGKNFPPPAPCGLELD